MSVCCAVNTLRSHLRGETPCPFTGAADGEAGQRHRASPCRSNATDRALSIDFIGLFGIRVVSRATSPDVRCCHCADQMVQWSSFHSLAPWTFDPRV